MHEAPLKLTLISSNESEDSLAVQMHERQNWSLAFVVIHYQKSKLMTQVTSIVAFGGIS